jgi:hypothetical protein
MVMQDNFLRRVASIIDFREGYKGAKMIALHLEPTENIFDSIQRIDLFLLIDSKFEGNQPVRFVDVDIKLEYNIKR